VPDDRAFVGFDAYKQVLDSGVDVVLLAAPPGFRPLHVKAAIEAGKHVFAEKPVAVDAPGVGAVIAAALAMEMSTEEIETRFRAALRGRALRPSRSPRRGRLDPAPLQASLREAFGKTLFEDLPMPLGVFATDLVGGQKLLLDRGPVWQALCASCAFPGVLPPATTDDGRLLSDSGIIDAEAMEAVHHRAGDAVVVDIRDLALARIGASPSMSAASASARSALLSARLRIDGAHDDLVLAPPVALNASTTGVRSFDGIVARARGWAEEQIERSANEPRSRIARLLARRRVELQA